MIHGANSWFHVVFQIFSANMIAMYGLCSSFIMDFIIITGPGIDKKLSSSICSATMQETADPRLKDLLILSFDCMVLNRFMAVPLSDTS